jgi:cobalt-zinc-cadmium efflux system membrane fusion protein
MKKIFVLFMILVCMVWSCKKNSPTPDRASDPSSRTQQQLLQDDESTVHEAGVHTHDGEELHIPPDKQKEWGIELETVKIESISSQLVLPGVMALDKNRTAHISSFVTGQVSSLSVDLGDKVKPGQTLVVINSPEFGQAKAAFLEARAELNLSRQEYDRAKRLLDDKAIEEKEYLRRKAEFEKNSTVYGAIGSKLHSFGITHEEIEDLIAKCMAIENKEYKCEIAEPFLPLLSPIAGTVIFRDAIIGKNIEPDKVILTISDLGILWAELDAFEKDIPFLSEASRVVIQSSLYPEKEFPGKITHVHDVIDEKLRTVKVRVEVKNTDNLLKPNMFIQGLIENTESKRILLSVPEDAIQNLDGKKVVFVSEGEDIFVARQVVLGRQVGNSRIISKGLIIGDVLVTKGAFSLKSELTKATFGHSHVH